MSKEVEQLGYNIDRDHRSTYSYSGSSEQGGALVLTPSYAAANVSIQRTSDEFINISEWEGLILYF